VGSLTFDSGTARAQELTADERLPYTLAVHAGHDADGRENPHAHLMISERWNDGIERSREQWFRRANSGHQERGGAETRTFHGREWMERAGAGRRSRTPRSNGTGATSVSITAATSARALIGSRANTSAPARRTPPHGATPTTDWTPPRPIVDHQEVLRAIEDEIARLEVTREALVRDVSERDEQQSGRRFDPARGQPDRGDDLIQER
jgi:hypothetical protein